MSPSISIQHSRLSDTDGGGGLVSNKPDHGDLFIPGAESAPQGLAPQPLDHFKRGYKERAELREREMGHLQQDFDRRPASSTAAGDHHRRQHNSQKHPFTRAGYHDERYPLGRGDRARSTGSASSNAGERGHDFDRGVPSTRSGGNDDYRSSSERLGKSRDFYKETETVGNRKRHYNDSPSNHCNSFSEHGSKRPHYSSPEKYNNTNRDNSGYNGSHRGSNRGRGYNINFQDQGNDVGCNSRDFCEDDKDRDRYNQRGRGNYSNNKYSSMSLMGFEVSDLVDRLCITPKSSIPKELEIARQNSPASFDTGKAITAILSALARRKEMNVALAVWNWMDDANIKRNVFHFNALISVCEKCKNYHLCMKLLSQMEHEKCNKNEVTFSSAISTCEKTGQWQRAIDLLHQMKSEGIPQTAIAYNAAISACEKALMPSKAIGIFEQMKREGVTPTVVTYSALISACEKGQQWRLALQVLEEMKAAGHGANVIAYSAAISALSKGQQWEKALELFREIEKNGGRPSVVTYNATMTALEKSLEWEKALDLFDEMKYKNMPVTVVSYGSAISACEKGYQWKQCLLFLDEMAERSIPKNVIIFGAAMSCMEKSCRADIAFQLMERMKVEGVTPNVHIYNSAISACARCNLWQEGLRLFEEMDSASKDVVTYNAILDAVSCNVPLARKLFQEGVERGFYARVSRLGTQWLELDLHFLSLGGGEIALGWWFEVCLVPYLGNSSKLAAVKSIDIVTGYGKTRMRGARSGGDGMRKRIIAMLRFMNIREVDQPNKGRIHIDKEALTAEVEKNGGKIVFDEEGYRKWKHEETTANQTPSVPQTVRNRNGAPRRDEDLGVGEQFRSSRHESTHTHTTSDNNGSFRERDVREPDAVISSRDSLVPRNNCTNDHSDDEDKLHRRPSNKSYSHDLPPHREGDECKPDRILSSRDATVPRNNNNTHGREAFNDTKVYSDGEIKPQFRPSNKPPPQDFLPYSRDVGHLCKQEEGYHRAPVGTVSGRGYQRSKSRSPPSFMMKKNHYSSIEHFEDSGRGYDSSHRSHIKARGRSPSFERLGPRNRRNVRNDRSTEQHYHFDGHTNSSNEEHNIHGSLYVTETSYQAGGGRNNEGRGGNRTRGYSPSDSNRGRRESNGNGSFCRNDRRGYDV